MSYLIGRRGGVLGFVAAAVLASGFAANAQAVNQVELTERHITGLLAAQNDFTPLAGKLADAADSPSKELQDQLDATAQKHGFKNFEEYRDVDNTIFLVLEGLDRESGDYVPPDERLELELQEIRGDSSIPDEDKNAIIEEVKEEMKLAEDVKFPGNIELVKKHIDKLAALLPSPEDAEDPRGSGNGDAPPQ